MSYLQDYDFSLLENETEYYVKKMVEEVLASNENYCRCQKCVVDYVALALNNLPAMYKVMSLGQMLDVNEKENLEESIRKEVMTAIEKVNSNPTH